MKDRRVTINEVHWHLMRCCILQTGGTGLPYFEIVELLGREEACRVSISLRYAPILLRHPLLVLLLLKLLFDGCLI